MRKLLIYTALLVAGNAFGSTYYWQENTNVESVLRKNGYHDIEVKYVQPRTCADGDYDWNSGVYRAISPAGHMSIGYTCGNNVVELKHTQT